MGTNYHWHGYSNIVCNHCGNAVVVERKELHIGKSSAGWVFTLHIYPDKGVNSLEDWKALWPKGKILDEYNCEITPEEMLRVITERKLALSF